VPVAEREVIERLFLASLIVGLCVSTANAEPYKSTYIKDLTTSHIATDSVIFDNKLLSYTVSYQSFPSNMLGILIEAYPVKDMRSALSDIAALYSQFVFADGLKNVDCRSSFDLNIFIIGKSEMRSSDRFAAYFASIGWEGGLVYAFYDSTPEIVGNSAILLMDLSPRQNYLSLAHEVAHYMWDRQCLSVHYGNNSELFAQRFEQFVTKNTD
jgi:hypothetical protein